MIPLPGDLDDWPVYPEDVEAILVFRMPEQPPKLSDCFICHEPIAPGNCMGIPGRGIAHPECYDALNVGDHA
jgi:hypothetical protein